MGVMSVGTLLFNLKKVTAVTAAMELRAITNATDQTLYL